MEAAATLPASTVLRHFGPALPWQVPGEVIEVVGGGPVLPVCRAAAEVGGDELVVGSDVIPDLTLEQTAAVRRTAQAINAIPRGQLLGALLLIGAVRCDVMQDAVQALGWEVPAEPEESRREAAERIRAERRQADAAIAEVVESFAADPAGAVALIEAERQANGPHATAEALGLTGYQGLAAVLKRLRGMVQAPATAVEEPAPPVVVVLPASRLRVVGVAPTVEAVAPADPAAERRRQGREAQARRRAGLAARRLEVQQRFSDPARRRWLLRQVVALVEAGQDPAVVFGQQTGLPAADAGRVLRELGIRVG